MRHFLGIGLGVLAVLPLGHSAVAELLVSPEAITLAGDRPGLLSRSLPPFQKFYLPGDRASQVTTTLTLSDSQGIQPIESGRVE